MHVISVGCAARGSALDPGEVDDQHDVVSQPMRNLAKLQKLIVNVLRLR